MIAVLLSFVVALLLCRLFLSSFSPLHILDNPNERSLHDTPTPRTGGVAILLAIAVGWAVLAQSQFWPSAMSWIASAAALVAIISFMDDLWELSPLYRIVIHGVAASVLMLGGMLVSDGWFGLLISWLAIVWMLNLYNFMDGMDGFAAGMMVVGFFAFACVGVLGGNASFVVYSLVVVAASGAFLHVNFPPARMFMGDVGSATAGMIVAGFSLWGMREGLFSWWFAVLVFSPFIVDATVTLLRRIINKERIWEAHRSHYYQRLVQLGWGHKKTVLSEYMIMLLAAGSALLACYLDSVLITVIVLFVWSVLYFCAALLVHYSEKTEVH